MVHSHSTTERLTLLDKVNVCLKDFGDHVMHLVFDCEGHVDREQLNRAVRLALIAHPIMAQQLIPGFFRYRWQPWNSENLDQYSFVETIESDQKEKRIHDFLIREIDFLAQPMVKVAIVRGTPSQQDTYQNNTNTNTYTNTEDTVCIKVSCIPIDGRGFLLFCESLLAIYEKLSENPNYQPKTGNLQQRSTKALVPYFTITDALKLIFFGLKNQLTDARTAHNWAFPYRSSNQIAKTYYCHRFNPSTFYQIKDLRAQHNLTFNDILLGAYYCALHDIIQPKKETLFCVLNTFDLRRHESAPCPDRVANYSSFVNSNVHLKQRWNFIDVCQRVKSSLDQRKAHYPGMTEGPFIWPLLSGLPFSISSTIVKALLKHRGEKIPVFTNVGIIHQNNMPMNGQPIKNVRPFAPLEFPPKLTVTLATSGDVVSLSVGFCRNHFQENHIHRLFQHMETLIQQAHANANSAAA